MIRSLVSPPALPGIALAAALIAVPTGAGAQAYDACYVPDVGALYLIGLEGLPTVCLSAEHVPISWGDGASNHGELSGLDADDHPQYLLADGTRPLAGALDAGGNALTGLAAATAAGEAVRFEQAVKGGDAAGGDLAGTYPAPQVAALRGNAVSGTAPASGQVLGWSGSAWEPTTPAGAVTDHGALSGLTDDDHAQYLLTDGVRSPADGFAVTGTFQSGTIPVQGGGVRVMWYPGKAAFRAGRAVGSEWDDANVGTQSIGLGAGTQASATSAVALGNFTTASGLYSFSMGSRAEASGNISAAFGFSTVAQSFYSMALGRYNVITGAPTGWVATDPILVVGNGTSTTRSNALTLLKNGNMTIAGTLTQSSDIRLKEDVEPLDGALDGVLRLTPVRYRFRPGTGHPTEPRLGLSAQEVEPVFPELVLRDSEGYLSVAYADLAAVLVRALQEQHAEVEALRAENEALRTELERRVATLEAALRRIEAAADGRP